MDEQDNELLEKNEELSTPESNKNYYKVIILGLMFLCLFSCFNSSCGMVVQIYQQLGFLFYFLLLCSQGYTNLGNLNLLVIYAVLAMNNLFASHIVEQFSFKFGMFITAWGYILYLGSGAMACACETNDSFFFCHQGVIYTVNIVCSMLCGFCGSLIWLAAAGYTTNICNSETKGKFFSTFWGLVQSSQITGNIMSIFILRWLSHFWYFVILFFASIASGCGYLMLPPVKNRELASREKKTVKQKMKDFIVCVWDPEIRQIFMFELFSGIFIGSSIFQLNQFFTGVYQGFLPNVISDSLPSGYTDREINVHSGYCFLVLGIFEFLGGLLNSYLSDRFDKYVLSNIGIGLIEMAFVVTFVAVNANSYVATFFAAGLFGYNLLLLFWIGFGECICQSLINTIIGTDLGNSLEAFAMYRLGQGSGVIFSQGFAIGLKHQTKWIYLLIMFVTQVITHGTMSQMQKRQTIIKYKKDLELGDKKVSDNNE